MDGHVATSQPGQNGMDLVNAHCRGATPAPARKTGASYAPSLPVRGTKKDLGGGRHKSPWSHPLDLHSDPIRES